MSSSRIHLLLSKLSTNRRTPKILLVAIIALFVLSIYPSMLTRFDPIALKERYERWNEERAKAQINLLEYAFFPDIDLYAYAGWEYIHGVSPDEINFEHPPLAKYLIGLSEAVFGNQNAIGGALGVGCLVVLYMLSKKSLRDELFALVPAYMLSLERIFVTSSSTSVLDVYLVFFLLASVFLLGEGQGLGRLVGGSIIFGLATACKLTALLALPVIAFSLLSRNKGIGLKRLLLFLSFGALTYSLCYVRFFTCGHTFEEFIHLQWRMLLFQREARHIFTYPTGRLLLTLLTGIVGPETRYFVVIEENQQAFSIATQHGIALAREFNPLTWPLSFSAAILAFYCGLKARRRDLIQSSVLALSFIFPFSLAHGFVWYYLPAFPFTFLLLTYFLTGRDRVERRRGPFTPLLLVYLTALFFWSRILKIPDFVAL